MSPRSRSVGFYWPQVEATVGAPNAYYALPQCDDLDEGVAYAGRACSRGAKTPSSLKALAAAGGGGASAWEHTSSNLKGGKSGYMASGKAGFMAAMLEAKRAKMRRRLEKEKLTKLTKPREGERSLDRTSRLPIPSSGQRGFIFLRKY